MNECKEKISCGALGLYQFFFDGPPSSQLLEVKTKVVQVSVLLVKVPRLFRRASRFSGQQGLATLCCIEEVLFSWSNSIFPKFSSILIQCSSNIHPFPKVQHGHFSFVDSQEEPCCWEQCLIGTCFGPVGPCCACWGFFLLGWLFTMIFMREAAGMMG